ncbi:hypothetical protein ONS96_009600 [Cadophora gregata f. sp. sojae]|nr:hypothetical protein ONS96_009600 [Cadophora gregata f. sp. sojae]
MDRFSTSRTSPKIWDPIKILGIINTDPGYQHITCVGYAPSKRRRCRIRINQYNRQRITNTLDEISFLQPNDPAVLSRLKSIAGAALCVRFHQDQASDILEQWRSKLPKVKKISSGTGNRTSGAKEHSQTMKDLQEQLRKLRELMDEVEENIHSQQFESSSDEVSEDSTSD